MKIQMSCLFLDGLSYGPLLLYFKGSNVASLIYARNNELVFYQAVVWKNLFSLKIYIWSLIPVTLLEVFLKSIDESVLGC